jgi:uridine kinase
MVEFLITIGGGSGSGKSTLASKLSSRLSQSAEIIELDWYYRDQSDLPLIQRERTNYDHPDAIELELLYEHIQLLRVGRVVMAPQYDFAQHNRSQSILRPVRPLKVVILEGIFALWSDKLNQLANLKIFVDTPSPMRLDRRLTRDVKERGRSPEPVRSQWVETVEPMFNSFCLSTAEQADLRVSGESIDDDLISMILARLELKNPVTTGAVGNL